MWNPGGYPSMTLSRPRTRLTKDLEEFVDERGWKIEDARKGAFYQPKILF